MSSRILVSSIQTFLHRNKFKLRDSTIQVSQIYRLKCVSRIIQNVECAFQWHNVKHKALDPPDNRHFYLWYVDKLVGRALSGIKGIPCWIHERTVFSYGKAYCCLNNMISKGGCSNNRGEFLDTRNPGGHRQGSSDRICCGQILPDECIREPQHPHHSTPSEPDSQHTSNGVSKVLQ